ncbi:MAG: hypothetical protein ACFB0D_16550 [Phormidesmis sp.]
MAKDSVVGRKQRDTADQKRDREVYRYLLALSDLGMSGEPPMPNETSIAKQWGGQENRIFIRRMLRSVLFKELYAEKEKEKEKKQPPVPGLTLSKLVSILSGLTDYQREHQFLDRNSKKASHIITRAEKLKALGLFFRLSPEERSQLTLDTHPEEALLNQIYEQATDEAATYRANDVRDLYRFFLRQLSEGPTKSFAEVKASTKGTDSKGFIPRIVADYTQQYSLGLRSAEKEERDRTFTKKVRREIDRIELQSGIEQASHFLDEDKGEPHSERLSNYLTADFIQRLVHSVIDNELLTDEFPIHFKHFRVERVKPLPLYLKQDNEEKGLLNPYFLPEHREAHSAEGLGRQVAYRVRVHFYIKPPKDYKVKFKDITILRNIAGQDRLEFSEEVVGIGCVTSHITAVINRVLLWDIPVLDGYIPIADGIHCHDEIVGGTPNSPIWSHCVARLYKREDIRQAIDSGKSCNEVITNAEVASADFCGFDLVETTAKAALHARLKLIRQTLNNQPNTSANDYITQLCNRVEEITALKRAQAALKFYPFSLKAMEGHIESTIFADGNYRTRKPKLVLKSKSNKHWSVVAFEAQLSIIEANLQEGLTHIARRFLDNMQPYFGDRNEQMGDLLMTRYHLCLFRANYLSDLEDPTCLFPDRHMAIRKAEEELEKAETYLTRRLQHYAKLGELPQSHLHPQFFFLSRVYAHRAKLYIFFSNYMQKLTPLEMLLKPIELLEKARIYAARDGDPSLYAQWSAYQSWCYIMLAYSDVSETSRSEEFSYDNCLDWAKRLIEHAEICYSETGKVCYQQIKDGGGRITDYVYPTESQSSTDVESDRDGNVVKSRGMPKYYEKYGKTMVEVVPLIQELLKNNGKKDQQRRKLDSHVVTLDLSLLKKPGQDEGSAVYLFGMQAGLLLFAKGVLVLSQTYQSEADLLKAIENGAMRMFQYCCAIASDGTARNQDKNKWPEDTASDSVVLNRAVPTDAKTDDPHATDRLIQCLYPRRITQFADLGRVFIIVCRLILLITSEPVQNFYASKQSWKAIAPIVDSQINRIRNLLSELCLNDQFPFPKAEAYGQKRYNGHLDAHHANLERYSEELLALLQKKKLKNREGIQLRNQLVSDIFEIIRGEVNVSPKI